eukprot:COSAG01_NODE_6676_length_3550_cov_35.719791_4_plen_103_part_01
MPAGAASHTRIAVGLARAARTRLPGHYYIFIMGPGVPGSEVLQLYKVQQLRAAARSQWSEFCYSSRLYCSISSFGVAKVNFLSERTLSCIDSDNAREETRRWR